MANKVNNYVAAISASVIALPAMSQSKLFEGSSFSLGLGSYQLKDATDLASKKWNGLGNIEFTQFKSLDDSWLLGFGVGLDMGTSKTAKSTGTGGETLFFDGFTNGALLPNSSNAYYGYQTGSARSISRKGNFSISVLPAYAFTSKDMGYIRLSLNRAKFNVSGGGSGGWLTAQQVNDAGGVPVNYGGGGNGCAAYPGSDACTYIGGASIGSTGSKYLHGLGLGVGYRRSINEKLFFQAEYKYVAYQKGDLLGVKPKDQGVVLGIGYRF